MINIYLVCAEINGVRLHKIGYTKRSIEDRIKEFRTGNASDFYIIDSFRSKWGTKIESSLHRVFKNKKIKGEWFNLTDQDLLSFQERCQTLHDNFELITKNNTYYLDKGSF